RGSRACQRTLLHSCRRAYRAERALSGFGQVALDKGVRELPLGARELDSFAVEPRVVDALLAELLSFSREGADLSEQVLDRSPRVAASEARGALGPQCRSVHLTHPHRLLNAGN